MMIMKKELIEKYKTALGNFEKAYLDLYKCMQYDGEDIVNESTALKVYPFDKSFEDLDIEIWCDNLRRLCVEDPTDELKRRALVARCQYIDKNGCYLDEDRAYEGWDPLTLEEAQQALDDLYNI
jgi:hypothetical protein